ncbi:MAG TPA: thiol peroxidase [Rhabdochlamydiaceae bacterium]|jgi:thiol peroxidase|nr:thiol peroxidase [Rhabdochlamydiaceae bacterium]
MAEVKLKGNVVHTNGKLPSKGQKAPEIHGVDIDLKEKTLTDFKGKKKIICFVPSLDTPVCSMSAQKFSEAVKKHPGTVVLYLSCDTPFALKRVCVAENGMGQIIPLSLVRSKKTAEDYGVLLKDGPLAGVCARAVVVLDGNDQVVYTQLVDEITTEPNYDQALAST